MIGKIAALPIFAEKTVAAFRPRIQTDLCPAFHRLPLTAAAEGDEPRRGLVSDKFPLRIGVKP